MLFLKKPNERGAELPGFNLPKRRNMSSSNTERVLFLTFMGLMAFNLLSTYVYLVGLEQAKAALRKAFRRQ